MEGIVVAKAAACIGAAITMGLGAVGPSRSRAYCYESMRKHR